MDCSFEYQSGSVLWRIVPKYIELKFNAGGACLGDFDFHAQIVQITDDRIETRRLTESDVDKIRYLAACKFLKI